MKNNVVISEYFTSMKVIKLVSFLTKKIVEKSITFSTTSKFMSNMHVGSIYKTPKNSKMMSGGWFAIKAFERSFDAKE